MQPCGAPRSPGHTLVECLTVCAVAALLAAAALPSFHAHQLRAGRLDAVDALTRVQAAQEQHRALHGLYAGDFGALRGTAPSSPQGRYDMELTLTGPESYAARATARGAQAGDSGCTTLTLEVASGFPSAGPSDACWNR
jgi:type IV pilus assembly protein PilE